MFYELNLQNLARPVDFTITSLKGGHMGTVPEPATWVLMVLGFGTTGTALRRRKQALMPFKGAQLQLLSARSDLSRVVPPL